MSMRSLLASSFKLSILGVTALISSTMSSQVMAETPKLHGEHTKDAVSATTSTAKVKLIDAELRAAFPSNAPGASVLVMQDGKILLKKAYGLANVELKVPARTGNLFHVASVGKQFTAAAILRLSEQHKLALNDPISKYFSGLPSSWSGIRIEHLLTHTSGIRNLFEDEKFRHAAYRSHTPAQLLAYAVAQDTIAAPGKQFSYATVNYSLLAMIIEKQSEKSYQDYLQTEFFQPLAMGHTIFDQTIGIIPNAVTPYQAGPVLAEHFDHSVGFGGGSYYSTTEDLAKWAQALHSNKILNASNTKAMHSAYQLETGGTIPYGFGTRPHQLAGEAYLQSNGDIQGFHSETVYLPKSKTYIAILSNGELFKYGLQPLAKRIAVIATGKKYEVAKLQTLSQAKLEKFTGHYKFQRDEYTIHSRGGKLYLEFPNSKNWVALSPLSESEFCYDSNTDFRIRFTEKTDGKHLAQWFEIDVLDDESDPVFTRETIPPVF
jgi:D-alanyl-D-alanine carboxypeptidase